MNSIQQLPSSVGSSTSVNPKLDHLIEQYEKAYERYAGDSKVDYGKQNNLAGMLAEIIFTVSQQRRDTKVMRQAANESDYKYGKEAAEKEYQAALKKFSSDICKAIGQGISGAAQIGGGVFAFKSGDALGKAQAGKQKSDAATTPTNKDYEHNVGIKMFFIAGGQMYEAMFNFWAAVYDKEGAEITKSKRFDELMQSMEGKNYDELNETQKALFDMMASVLQVIQDINANDHSVTTKILTFS